MEVRLLGSGGWLPTDRRETACVYLREGADVLLLDAGTGLRRLATDRELLEGVERLHVTLSHFHLDHTFGLMALPALRALPVRELWAPGRLVAGASADAMIQRLLGPPFLARTPDDVAEYLTAIHELEGGVEIGPFRVEIRLQPLHSGPTVAYKVNDELAYCTDTAYDEDNVEFVRGARVLLHEAMHAGDTTEDTTHAAAGEAARIAAGAGVERLVLVHLHPLWADEDALLASAVPRFAATGVGRDGPL